MLRGDVFLVNFNFSKKRRGSEQKGIRPALIVQNDIGNKYSNTTIIAALTSKTQNKPLPINIFVSKKESNLPKDSLILLGHLMTVDKSRLTKFLTHLPLDVMKKVDKGLKISLGLKG